MGNRERLVPRYARRDCPWVFRLSIPLPNDSGGLVNVYAVVSRDGPRLIDSGWNAPEADTALVDGQQEHGVQMSNIKEVMLIHNHPDHIGLAEQLVQESAAYLLLAILQGSSLYLKNVRLKRP